MDERARATPRGIGKFVKAKLVQSWLVIVPIPAAITTVTLVLGPQASIFSLLACISSMIFFVTGNFTLTLGLSILNPQFSESACAQMGGLMVNADIAMFASIGIFIGSMVILDPGIFSTLLLQNMVIWLMGIILLYIGKRKLNKIK